MKKGSAPLLNNNRGGALFMSDFNHKINLKNCF